MNATLSHTHQEAESITTFYFTPERPLRYVAGQFIELTIPHADPDNRGVKRWFTLSSAPGHEQISITTKLADTPSSFKKHLWQLQPGESVDISEAMGDFVLPVDSARPLVFVAGGIGITPYHAIVQWLLDTNQQRTIQFIYSVNSHEEVIFRDTFNHDFIVRTERIAQPNLTAESIVDIAGGISGKQVYLSGPEPMTEALVKQFKKLSITQDQLITDYFPGYSAI